MGPIRNRSKPKHFTLSTNMNNSPVDKNEYHSTHQSNEDCFAKVGFISSTKENNPKQEFDDDNENEQNQSADLVEEIDAIIALFIYDIFTRKQKLPFDRKQQTKNLSSSNSNYDDISRFDSIYSCLINQSLSHNDPLKKSYHVQNHLRDRFFTLPEINEFNDFEQNEQSRVYEERQEVLKRVPFIPNVRSYQRTCPYYNLNEIKRIRDQIV